MAQKPPEPHPVEFSPEEVDLDQNMTELQEKVEYKKVDDPESGIAEIISKQGKSSNAMLMMVKIFFVIA
ncbi:hypothetical protein G6F37_009641 [Rhizopus arrhizus]|nr:hypothetical protein G6F38_009721 [Rhizopus arrhizus]KAG1154225.1 hypothetical protein G6F37_009641 [Rhizopus arrhizus]